MTSPIAACSFALFSVVILQSIAPLSEKFKGYVTLASSLIFFLLFFKTAKPLWELFSSITEKSQSSEIFQAIFKGLGISLLVSLCASFCRDLGENGVAEKLELCGKAATLSLAIPFLYSLLEMMGGLLE